MYITKEVDFVLEVIGVLSYFTTFLYACLLHMNHVQSNGYQYYQVEDIVHFFLIIEILNYASMLLVNMIVLLVASFRNEQLRIKKTMPGMKNESPRPPAQENDSAGSDEEGD